ncbi:hypothetical protein [Leptolyngbya sp. FACHB-711]|uniref:hypothetical protein n=1 Tax=Leptolyngbya sp. FACHB-711 TaxID=2692813 RepID=UPI0016827C2D|nr:hypothetical protein [Leptolyngbya sp. FACHB-711]MBD1848456.1 hypothetical protein [Cyanobacteria bacterium FACHB-502]MBD2028228.1 hypothetical protein [Leptolyngbya sp. FACHB-711]
MNSSQQLVQCPKCHCSVRFDRLENHLKKVHCQELDVNNEENLEEFAESLECLTRDKFQEVISLINFWLRSKKDYLYNTNNVRILTIMALENFMGYSFDEINKLYSNRIQRKLYETGAKRLEVLYEEMIDCLYKTSTHYSKHYIDRKNRKKYYFENGGFNGYVDWYACNSVDRMDGSKYIGYHRREYDDSRFGSLPIHDDYSEESWADDNPWE